MHRVIVRSSLIALAACGSGAATAPPDVDGGTTPAATPEGGALAEAGAPVDGRAPAPDADGGAGADAGGGADAGLEASAPCTLAPSGPVTVTHDGQIVENLRITASGSVGITVSGFANVVVRNVEVLHTGAQGIVLDSAPGARLENVVVTYTSAPDAGPNPSPDLNNILIQSSSGVTVDGARLTRGSSGIHLYQSPSSVLRNIEGHDFRGPLPRGQLVQWDSSDDGLLELFSVVNPLGTSWPEDCVNIYKSLRVTVRQGLVDGDNSPTGFGVIFDGDTSSGLVEDVDAVHMGTGGCFSDYAGVDGNVFRRTRCRDNVCTSIQGRGVGDSNALMWCGKPGATAIRLESSTYFNPCNPGNIIWPASSFAVADVTEASFVPRAALALKMCWE